jgi:hypothetical protein
MRMADAVKLAREALEDPDAQRVAVRSMEFYRACMGDMATG